MGARRCRIARQAQKLWSVNSRSCRAGEVGTSSTSPLRLDAPSIQRLVHNQIRKESPIIREVRFQEPGNYFVIKWLEFLGIPHMWFCRVGSRFRAGSVPWTPCEDASEVQYISRRQAVAHRSLFGSHVWDHGGLVHDLTGVLIKN
jgi:hypothetical protein